MVHSLNLQLPKFLFDMQLDSTSSDNLKLVLTALFPSICNIDFSGTGLDLSAITTTLHELIVTNCSLKCVTQILGVGQYFLPITVLSYLWFIVLLVIIYPICHWNLFFKLFWLGSTLQMIDLIQSTLLSVQAAGCAYDLLLVQDLKSGLS